MIELWFMVDIGRHGNDLCIYVHSYNGFIYSPTCNWGGPSPCTDRCHLPTFHPWNDFSAVLQYIAPFFGSPVAIHWWIIQWIIILSLLLGDRTWGGKHILLQTHFRHSHKYLICVYTDISIYIYIYVYIPVNSGNPRWASLVPISFLPCLWRW